MSEHKGELTEAAIGKKEQGVGGGAHDVLIDLGQSHGWISPFVPGS